MSKKKGNQTGTTQLCVWVPVVVHKTVKTKATEEDCSMSWWVLERLLSCPKCGENHLEEVTEDLLPEMFTMSELKRALQLLEEVMDAVIMPQGRDDDKFRQWGVSGEYKVTCSWVTRRVEAAMMEIEKAIERRE